MGFALHDLAPRVLTAGRVPLLCDRLTVRGLAALLAFLRDFGGGAEWGTPGAAAVLCGAGRPLLCWCGMYRLRPGLTLAEAAAVAAAMDDAEAARLLDVLMDSGLPREESRPGRVPPSWPLAIDRLAEARRWPYAAVLDLTLDEFGNACARGEPGVRDLGQGDAAARLAARRRRIEAGEEQPAPLPPGAAEVLAYLARRQQSPGPGHPPEVAGAIAELERAKAGRAAESDGADQDRENVPI